MSPDNDLLFTHSDTLLMSHFSNLTEFDNFPEDLFLSNAMEEIADGGLLGELDCKDDLKPLLNCEVNNAFGALLKDNDSNSMKGRLNPFTMFINEETSESLGLMDMAVKVDLPKVSDGVEKHGMGLSSTIKHMPPLSSAEEGVLSTYRDFKAGSKLDCMSLHELDLTHANATDALRAMSARSSLQVASSVISGNGIEPASSLVAPLSSIGKAPMNQILLRREALPLCSTEIVPPSILQVNSPVISPSSKTAFSSSDAGALINLMLRGEEASSIHSVKGSLAQTTSVLGVEPRGFGISNAMQSQCPSPCIQRSQSSHALGQLRMSGRVGPCNEEFNVLPSCKQEVSLSNTSNVSLFTPYQAANTQGSTGSPPSAPIRRVYSTGDLQASRAVQNFYGGNRVNAIAEESAGVKFGHYTKEERKMKLHRYRQKRTERNFSKKIKYACRKTLADSRPRVRGRFARTDEMGDSSFRGCDLPLIDEYEEVTSHCPRMIPDRQQTYLMPNSSCIIASASIAQFWNSVGMKVAM